MTVVYQITDCHLSDETSYKNVEFALQTISESKSCDAILMTGDLCCSPKQGDYLKLAKFVDRFITDTPIYAIAGNHDDLGLMINEFKNTNIRVTDKARIGTRDFLFVDSSQKPIDPSLPLALAE